MRRTVAALWQVVVTFAGAGRLVKGKAKKGANRGRHRGVFSAQARSDARRRSSEFCEAFYVDT